MNYKSQGQRSAAYRSRKCREIIRKLAEQGRRKGRKGQGRNKQKYQAAHRKEHPAGKGKNNSQGNYRYTINMLRQRRKIDKKAEGKASGGSRTNILKK